MSEHRTFHLRPVLASSAPLTILAASDSFFLIRQMETDYYVVDADLFGKEDDLLVDSRKLPAGLISRHAKPFCFLDSATLCFCEATAESRDLVVIRDVNNNQAQLSCVVYSIHETTVDWPGFQVYSMGERNGQPVVVLFYTTGNVHFTFRMAVKWSVTLPEREGEEHQVKQMAMHTDPREGELESAFSVGGFLLRQMRTPSGLKTVASDWRPMTAILNGREITGNKVHTVDWVNTEPKIFFSQGEDRLLAVECTPEFILLSFVDVGDECTVQSYRADMPIPSAERTKSSDDECHAFLSGNRLFLQLGGIILMGYLPGADVSLEAATVADVWRQLSEGSQTALIARGHCSNRSILLAAVEKDKNRDTTQGKC